MSRSEDELVSPISVNLVATTSCNYKCRFCFGDFRNFIKYPVDDSRILEIPSILASSGCEKLTLEGGEPFLYRKLPLLIREAKRAGLTTSIVTNGSLVTQKRLRKLSPHLDWLAISLDSPLDQVEKQLGRGNGGHVENCKKVAQWAQDAGIRLKINSVITKLNYQHNLSEVILDIKPDRWKVFQLLVVKGVNEGALDLELTDFEFKEFVEKHRWIRKKGIDFAPEWCNDMMGSYVMLLPDGRFFQNFTGNYTFSRDTIFDCAVENVLSEVGWDRGKFLRRGGDYHWKRDVLECSYVKAVDNCIKGEI